MPQVTFTDPQVASAGLTEAEAREVTAEGVYVHAICLGPVATKLYERIGASLGVEGPEWVNRVILCKR